MKGRASVTGVFLAVMCLAFVLPLVVAPEESDWLDPLTSQLVSFIAVALMSLILGDLGETTLRLPILGRICGLIAVGIILGFVFGVLVELCSGGSELRLLWHPLVPFWIKGFCAKYQLETTYAPLYGMLTVPRLRSGIAGWNGRAIFLAIIGK
jgi:hypothetical protein